MADEGFISVFTVICKVDNAPCSRKKALRAAFFYFRPKTAFAYSSLVLKTASHPAKWNMGYLARYCAGFLKDELPVVVPMHIQYTNINTRGTYTEGARQAALQM